MTQKELEDEIAKRNEECQKCKSDFEKAQITFRPSMCSKCNNGAKFHELLIQAYDGEKKLGELDWNSSKYKDLYRNNF